MHPGERFEEIVDRHDQDSVVAHSRAATRLQICGSVVRTQRRVHSSEPVNGLLVNPVKLGFTTLLPYRGHLT